MLGVKETGREIKLVFKVIDIFGIFDWVILSNFLVLQLADRFTGDVFRC